MALTVEYLQNTAGTISVPVKELQLRTIQLYQAEYTSGEWNPDTNYNWIPGTWADFTPRRADSRIKYTMRLPLAWSNAAHGISHLYFWAAGTLYWYWSESGTHYENAKMFQFEVPSWGTSTQRIGMQLRSYANDNHELRAFRTYYWDGVGSVQNSKGHLMIEEVIY